VTGQHAARILDSSGYHSTPHNQELAPTPLTVLGKYTVALPYVIGRKTSGGLKLVWPECTGDEMDDLFPVRADTLEVDARAADRPHAFRNDCTAG